MASSTLARFVGRLSTLGSSGTSSTFTTRSASWSRGREVADEFLFLFLSSPLVGVGVVTVSSILARLVGLLSDLGSSGIISTLTTHSLLGSIGAIIVVCFTFGTTGAGVTLGGMVSGFLLFIPYDLFFGGITEVSKCWR